MEILLALAVGMVHYQDPSRVEGSMTLTTKR
jgi:hypothetical protein